jgi:hypothetical protein
MNWLENKIAKRIIRSGGYYERRRQKMIRAAWYYEQEARFQSCHESKTLYNYYTQRANEYRQRAAWYVKKFMEKYY